MVGLVNEHITKAEVAEKGEVRCHSSRRFGPGQSDIGGFGAKGDGEFVNELAQKSRFARPTRSDQEKTGDRPRLLTRNVE